MFNVLNALEKINKSNKNIVEKGPQYVANLIKTKKEQMSSIDYINYLNRILITAVSENKIAVVALLLENGADVNFIDRGLNWRTPLMSIQGDNVDIAKLLIEKGANLNLRDRYQDTALTYAIRNRNFNIIKLLIRHGADVNTIDIYDISPLSEVLRSYELALKYNNPVIKSKMYEIIELLIQNGARLYPYQLLDLKYQDQLNIYNEILSKLKNNKNLKSFIISGKENSNGRRLMGSTLEPGLQAPINASTLRLIKNFTGKKYTGGSQFIHIPSFGKRKVRFQKNGKPYVIVNKKKLKL